MHTDLLSSAEVYASSSTGPVTMIIAVSADASPEMIARALEAGFDEFWTKPIDVRRLRQRLHEHAGDLRNEPGARHAAVGAPAARPAEPA